MTTPKRKRSQLLAEDIPSLNTARFSFGVPPSLPEDGSNSPRTKVAHRFHGLSLEGGGGVKVTDPDRGRDAVERHHDTDIGVRKRVKLPLVGAHTPEPDEVRQRAVDIVEPVSEATAPASPPAAVVQAGASTKDDKKQLSTANYYIPIRPMPTRESVEAGGDPQHPRPISPSLLSAVKLRNSKRIGTPPPPSAQFEVVDPVRAALTWHEDEITIYDPDDSDDDGTGINGIGFKPTPAIAHSRTVRRKQQLAEYRKREEREARARRSQRRRGSPGPSLADLKGRVERRKVRFMESGQASAVGAV
jgi:hypothetical protein